jgi:hypothetical protein
MIGESSLRLNWLAYQHFSVFEAKSREHTCLENASLWIVLDKDK